MDLRDIHGQESAKFALEVALAGDHNILFTGPPGSGKTMLARCMPGLLPKISRDEAIEVTKVYSSLGRWDGGLVRRRPFRAPHHTITPAAMVGGGRLVRPGEVSLAHRGVLYLDEFPEFSRAALEVLRQPLEDQRVHVSRVSGTCVVPAAFLLGASANPCPCGFLGLKCAAVAAVLVRSRGTDGS